ncbi:hypothetical protein KJ680_07830 [bacterium]|nr:hypothetical protein [bacterium]
MIVKIIGSLLIIGFFLLLNKVGAALLERDNLLYRFFPIASTLMALFLIGLIFFG